MERQRIEQMFFEEYGYIGSEGELEWFISKYGGDHYQSYEQYRSLGNAGRFGSTDSNADDISDISYAKDAFTALFKELIGQAKKKEMPENSNELTSEFTFMLVLFLLKTSLFFVLRFGQDKGFCCNL